MSQYQINIHIDKYFSKMCIQLCYIVKIMLTINSTRFKWAIHKGASSGHQRTKKLFTVNTECIRKYPMYIIKNNTPRGRLPHNYTICFINLLGNNWVKSVTCLVRAATPCIIINVLQIYSICFIRFQSVISSHHVICCSN